MNFSFFTKFAPAGGQGAVNFLFTAAGFCCKMGESARESRADSLLKRGGADVSQTLIPGSVLAISGQAAARVPDELDERLLAALTGPDDGVVVSGPAPAGGVPSTIVEPLAGTDLRVLRLGAVSLEALKAAGFTPHLA